MDPASAMGYHAAQSTVVAYDYHNDVFFLANGARVPSDAPLQPPERTPRHEVPTTHSGCPRRRARSLRSS